MMNVGRSLYAVVALGIVLGGQPGCADVDAGRDGDEPLALGQADEQEDLELGQSESALWWRRFRRGRPSCPPASSPTTQTKDVVGTALADGRFTILAKALTDTGLVGTLQGSGPFTVFAPTDAAFQALGAGVLETLTKEQLTTILTYHVIGADLPSTALKAGPVATVSGLSAFVSIADGKVKVNDAIVTTADVKASNGVIHVIDKVLLPPNLVQAATYAGSFSTLLGAATTAGLADALSAPDADLTVFAPTDAAFEKIASTVAGLSTSQLADVLKYHVVSGRVLSTALTEGAVPTLLTGKSVTVSLKNGVKIDEANVIVKDVVTTNGVIHVIDAVLVPAP